MEGTTKQTRAFEAVLPLSTGVRIEMSHDDSNPSGNNPTYWGVLCRSCAELVAFDISPYCSFGAGAANVKPGAIRCAHGHNHIYIPRDFQFFLSDFPISDVAIQANREAHRAVNPSSQASSNAPGGSEDVDEPNLPPTQYAEWKRTSQVLFPMR